MTRVEEPERLRYAPRGRFEARVQVQVFIDAGFLDVVRNIADIGNHLGTGAGRQRA